jgi:hypothetical protein
MRRFGQILILVGLLGFVYASSAQDGTPPAPEGVSLSAEMASPGGRLELLRYGSAGAAFLGVLLALFPKGR